MKALCGFELMVRGMAWLYGHPDSLHEAASYIRTLEHAARAQGGLPEKWPGGWGGLMTTQL